MSDINHPKHYNSGKIEVIEFIEDQKLNFARGNAVKYISRAGKKDPTKEIEDLEKSLWYIRREVELLKAIKDGREPSRPNDMNPRDDAQLPLLNSNGGDVLDLTPQEKCQLHGHKWEYLSNNDPISRVKFCSVCGDGCPHKWSRFSDDVETCSRCNTTRMVL
jgi:hypothetical protein